jgi:hypothetical protein
MPIGMSIFPNEEAAVTHSHMVIYQTSDGEPGSRQFDEIGAAIAFVEEMRNRSGVDVARIFKLEEVKFEFRPYYQVLVVEGSEASAAPVAPATDSAAPAEPVPAEPVTEQVPASDESSPLAATATNEVASSVDSASANAAPAAEPSEEPAVAHAMPAASTEASEPSAPESSGEEMAAAGADPSGATRRGLFGR